nr:hypothetical protein [Tanacetum cinerariifolium]
VGWVRLPSICRLIGSDGYTYPVFVRCLDRMGTPTQYCDYWSGWVCLDELSDKELKQIEANDQAIQTILLGLPEGIYAAVDSCETTQEIWLRVQQMMKGSDIGIQEKKTKLFNEWERTTWKQPMPNPEDITDPTTAMNMALALMAKTFKLNYSSPTNNIQRISSNPRNRQIAQPGMNMGQDRQMQLVGGNGNQNQIENGNGNLVVARAEGNAAGQNGNHTRCYNCRGVGHYARNCTVRLRRRDAAYLQTHILIAQKEDAGIQLQAEEYDLMAAAADLDEIKEVNANCILMANLQKALTSVPQNDNDVISEDTNVEQCGETLEQHPVNFEETRALYESLYQNLATEVEKVN